MMLRQIARDLVVAIIIGGVAIGLGMAVTDIAPLHAEDWRWRYGLRLAIAVGGAVLQLRTTPSEKGVLRILYTILIVITVTPSIGHMLDLAEGERVVNGVTELVHTQRRLE